MKRIAVIGILAAIFLMFATPAGASRIKVLNQPVVRGDTVNSLGTVLIEITGGALQNGNTGIIGLPEDFRFCNEGGSTMRQSDWVEQVGTDVIKIGNTKNYVKIPRIYNGNANGLYGSGNLSVIQLDENEIMLKVNAAPSTTEESYILLYLGAIYINEGAGDIHLSTRAPSNSGFPFPSSDKVGRTPGNKIKVDTPDQADDKDDQADDKTGIVDEPIDEEDETVAVDKRDIELTIGSSHATVNGNLVVLDAAPYINAGGYAMVPLRFIAEALDTRVEWLPAQLQVNIYGSSDILMNTETAETYIDNELYELKCRPEVMSPGRVFVPLRFVTEMQGAKVDYAKDTKIITIIKS